MESFIDYEDAKKHIPPAVQEHLLGLVAHSRLPPTDETLLRLTEAWLLKKAAFQKTVEHGRFRASQAFKKDDPSGCLVLTLSGSLITVGPPAGGRREIKYASLGMRTDVPESLVIADGVLAEDIECGRPLRLSSSKLQKTSVVTDLALTQGTDEAAVLRQADDKLTGDFIRFNRQALGERGADDILRRRDDLFNQWIIIQWFIYGGLEKHVFMARAKLLWLDLFTKVYDALSAKEHDPGKRDAAFLAFTNELFAKFCDDYKWYESENKNFDIGLMKALEELPEYIPYLDFVEQYCRRL